MKKLIEKINNRINNLTKENINSYYNDCISYFNKEILKPYDEMDNYFGAIYTYLLIVSEIGIDNSDKVKSLINNCAAFFCNDIYDDDFYIDYYDKLELLYKKNKLDLLYSDNYDNEEPNIKIAVQSLKTYNQQIMDEIFYLHSKPEEINNFIKVSNNNNLIQFKYLSIEQNGIDSIIQLFKLCPKKEIYQQFLEINYLTDFCKTIKEDKRYKLAIKLFSKRTIYKDINAYINSIIKRKNYKINDNKLKINNYWAELVKNIKRKNTTNNKINKNYTSLINFLNTNKNYIDDIDKYLKLIDDEEIKEEFLKFVINYNSVYNKQIELENNKLKKMQVSSLELLFSKYNFDFNFLNEIDKNKIAEIENIEEKLQLLNKDGFKFINTKSLLFMPIMYNFNIKQISFLEKLCENNIIDEQFLNENILDLSIREIFLNFVTNIQLLKNIGLERITKYDKNIFLEDSILLSKRYKLFVEHYKFSIDNIYNFEFLKNDYIFDMIDNFIELGYFEQIKNNPDYLISKNSLMIKRLEIAKLIDMKTINSDNSFVGSIVSGNNFYVSDKMLDEFLIDYKDEYIDINLLDNYNRLDISNDYFDILDEYKNDEYTYKIGDALLSKNRILRNLTSLVECNNPDILLNSILYKSINLTEEQISNISKICSYKSKKLK